MLLRGLSPTKGERGIAMRESVIVVPGIFDPKEGSFVDVYDSNFKRWPEKPTGKAASSERGQAVEIAAAAQAMPEIEIFEHINFGGHSWRTNLNYLYVGGWWNDRVSSMVVIRGRWRFYMHRDYMGPYWDVNPGYYPWVEDVNIPNDIISSFRCIGL
jgi:hypothetical protein